MHLVPIIFFFLSFLSSLTLHTVYAVRMVRPLVEVDSTTTVVVCMRNTFALRLILCLDKMVRIKCYRDVGFMLTRAHTTNQHTYSYVIRIHLTMVKE